MLENYVRSFHEDPLSRAGAIHPSSLKGCSRQAVWQYQGIEPDRQYTEEELRVFATGYMVEGFVAKAMYHGKVLIANCVPVSASYDGIEVEGEIDFLLRVDDKWSICDVKATNSWGLKHYDSYPYDHHVTQIGLYSWCIKQTYERAIYGYPLEEQGDLLLLYVGRDDLYERPCWVDAQYAETKALAELTQVVQCIHDDTTPDRPFASPEEHPWLCAKCLAKGYMKKDHTYSPGKEPVYAVSCIYFHSCWNVSKELTKWNFWEEVL